MAITTYSELQTAVANWLNRSDLTSRIPEFITLAESYLGKKLRVRDQIKRVQATLNEEFEDLPTDFLQTVSIHLTTSPITILSQMTQGAMLEANPSSSTGKPVNYSIVGDKLRFRPAPDAAYTMELSYYADIPPLSGSNTTNWLLTGHPETYLYTTLLMAEPFLGNDARISTWATLVLESIDLIKKEEASILFSTVPTNTNIRGVTIV